MRFPNRFTRHWGGAASNITILALVTLVAGGVRAPAETQEVPTRDLRIRASSVESRRLLREIDDPSSGARWLLVGDKTNPGGPGRLEPAPRVSLTDPGAAGKRTNSPQVGQTRPVTMIQPGDKLVVEEHSAIIDACLEGVALGPAGPGTTLHVRLSIGGRVVRAVAVGPGRATLGTLTGAGR